MEIISAHSQSSLSFRRCTQDLPSLAPGTKEGNRHPDRRCPALASPHPEAPGAGQRPRRRRHGRAGPGSGWEGVGPAERSRAEPPTLGNAFRDERSSRGRELSRRSAPEGSGTRCHSSLPRGEGTRPLTAQDAQVTKKQQAEATTRHLPSNSRSSPAAAAANNRRAAARREARSGLWGRLGFASARSRAVPAGRGRRAGGVKGSCEAGAAARAQCPRLPSSASAPRSPPESLLSALGRRHSKTFNVCEEWRHRPAPAPSAATRGRQRGCAPTTARPALLRLGSEAAPTAPLSSSSFFCPYCLAGAVPLCIPGLYRIVFCSASLPFSY